MFSFSVVCQDAVNSSNFPQDVRPSSFVHLALYVDKAPLSLSHMFRNINLLDSFCKKLRTTSVSLSLSLSLSLSRIYMGLLLISNEINANASFLQLLRDEKAVHGFLRFIIQVLVSAPDNLVGSI